MTTITIGADPEVFIRRKADKVLVSAHNLIPGTKEQPYPVPKGAIQVDGVAAEFNIEPSFMNVEFAQNCNAVLGELRERIGAEFELSLQPTAIFDQAIWDTIPEEVKILGCTPDHNAWTGNVNPRPPGQNTTMRVAGGHVHSGGWTKDADVNDPVHQMDCCTIGQTYDYFLGLPSLIWDDDTQRRQMYGKAGSIRFKPYGVEYRSLSNAWLRSDDLMQFVHRAAVAGIFCIIEGGWNPIEQLGNIAEFIINNSIKWWTEEGVSKIKEAGLWQDGWKEGWFKPVNYFDYIGVAPTDSMRKVLAKAA